MANDKETGAGPGASQVEVQVNYQAKTQTASFPRPTRVAEVLAWALDVFKIDPAIATEVELSLEGSNEELQGSKPIGSLLKGENVLRLDLIRGDIANGSE